MADALATPEAVARAAIEKPKAENTALPEEKQAQQRAAMRIEEQSRNDNPRSAIELAGVTPIDQKKIIANVDRKIGHDGWKPDGTKKRKGVQEANYNNATKNLLFANEFLENGFDRLSSVQQDALVNSMEGIILANVPLSADIFSGMDPAQKRGVIAQMLKDPSFSLKVKGHLEAAIDSNKLLPEIPADIKKRVSDAESKIAVKKREIADKGKEVSDVISDYERDFIMPGGAEGPKMARINHLRGNRAANEAQLKNAQANKKTEDRELRHLEDELATVRNIRPVDVARVNNLLGDIKTKKNDISALDDKIVTCESEKHELTALEAEKVRLEQERKRLEGEKLVLEDERDALGRELSLVKAEENQILLDRQHFESQFVESSGKIFSNALRDQLISNLEKAEQAQKKLLEEEKANVKDPAERALLDAIDNRWDSPSRTVKGRRTTVPNKGRIERDYTLLVNSGPDAVIRRMLQDQVDSSGARLFSDADIDAKLGDNDFMGKVQPRVLETLITKRVQTGNLSPSEVVKFASTEWGKAAVNKAIENRKAAKDMLQKLRDEGVIKGNLWDTLKNASEGSLLRFFLILFGGAVTLGAGPAAVALRNALRS